MLELSLDELTIIYPGEISYSLGKNIQVVGFNEYLSRNQKIWI